MTSYFELRNVAPEQYARYEMSAWLLRQLREVPKEACVLDFGCGFGQVIQALKALGYSRTEGADIEPAAIAHGMASGHIVSDLRASDDFFEARRGQFDVIIAQHVLEHIAKGEVVHTVQRLRGLLRPNGKLIVAVPNGQAFTGAYWAYEDVTHETLYTAGSIYHVLRAGGFSDVQFLDIDCTAGLGPVKATIRRAGWSLFSFYYKLMCRLLVSPTHAASPNIFSYEIKVVAR